MDKNAIKKYAVWARTELIERVRQRALKYEVAADADINADSASGKVLTDIEKTQRQAAIARMREKGYEYVIEEVAYTWFNRFAALRYMEVNNYLPTRVRVFTDENGAFKPQILTEAIHLNLEGLDMEKVYALKEAENNDELYKYLLLTQCNALSSALPQMFKPVDDRCKEEKNDYTLLLFPDNQLREGSVIEQMVSLIPEDNWLDAVQIIGWLYQYYNSEPKDKVFADLKKNIKITKENIPAATQLFTPDWIVRYMVENSLGRLWLEGHANDALKSEWKYYLDEAQQEPEVEAQLSKIRKDYAALRPEDILCIDPCMGSGHILAYLFDTLMKIYAAYGYSTRESVQSIIEHNLYGLDIDDRAAQLAYFEVMMTAVKYDNRFLKRSEVPQPHVYAIQESNHIQYEQEFGDFLLSEEHRETLRYLLGVFQDAKEYGSILQVNKRDYVGFLEAWKSCAEESLENIMMMGWYMQADERVQALARQAFALSQEYDVVTTNPPYMGGSGMSPALSEFVKSNYPNGKADLFAVFIEKGSTMIKQSGCSCMVTMQSWMFLASFEKMRSKLLETKTITNLLHMDNMVMGIAFGTAVSVLRSVHLKKYKGTYTYVEMSDIRDDVPKTFPITDRRFAQVCSDSFFKVPGAPVAYWISDRVRDLFSFDSVGSFTLSDGQNKTGNNERFMRSWWEVVSDNVGKEKPWVLCARGGAYRKWYGNIEEVIDWSEAARKHYRGDHVARIVPEYIWYKPGFTWSRITSYKASFRLQPSYMLFEMTGLTLFVNDVKSLPYMLGLMNSKVAEYLLGIITQVMTIQLRDVQAIPVINDKANYSICTSKAAENIDFSKSDWDSFETSWDFSQHPLVKWKKGLWDCTAIEATMSYYEGDNNPKEFSCPMELCYLLWQGECNERFKKLKANEEELNCIFIDIYGLQDELLPEVEDKDVTVRKADLQRDIKSFISYAVGCMLGRYSLDVEGLVYAGGEFDTKYCRWIRQFGDAATERIDEYGRLREGGWAGSSMLKYDGVRKGDKWIKATFPVDTDNIIPICDDEYFEDDITGLFVKFVETVYGKDTLDANLKFIADALGGKGTPKEVIRNYFLNDFFNDHCKIYQKRPIYWLFDSGKKNGFKALVYMHRYQPDTIARMRTDYVHEQQSRYRTATADLESRIADASTAERVRLNKQLTKLRDQSEEIRKYEEKIHHLADQYIAIDLDDGVKVNYAKFQEVLAKIK